MVKQKWVLALLWTAFVTTASAAAVQYTYDSLSRLVRVVYPDGTIVGYTYDPAGNRLSQSVTNPSIATPKIAADKTSLEFTTSAGQTSTATQIVAVSNTGGGSLQWNAVSSVPWLSVTPNSGTNAGQLTVSASAASLPAGNYSGGVVIYASASNTPLTIPVTFNVSGCVQGISPGGQAFAPAGGSGAIRVAAEDGCAWTILSNLNWVTFTSASGGIGSGTATFEVPQNPGPARRGSMGIAGFTFGVEQQDSDTGRLSLLGAMAHFASAGDWKTTTTLINTGATESTARVTFFGDSGSLLPLPLTFPQRVSDAGPVLAPTLDRTLAPNATLVMESTGLTSDPVQTGSAQLRADGNVTGFSTFRWNANGQEAAVPLEARNAGSYTLAFDNTNGVATGVAVSNLATQSADIPVVVRDEGGASIATTTLTLPGEGHTSFNLAERYPVTANQRGTVEFDTPVGGRLSAVGLRFTPSGAFTTLPVLADVGNGGGMMAHLASAGDWETAITLVNTSDAPAQAHLGFFDDDGLPLFLPVTFPQSGSAVTLASSVDRTLAPRSLVIIDTTGPSSDPLRTGSIQLTTDGNVTGFNIFRWNANGQEASVPLETRAAPSYVLAFDNTSGLVTGVAVANSTAQAVTIPVLVRDDTGAAIGATTVSLTSQGHTSFGLADLLPSTADKRGTVEFQTPTGGRISVLGLRFTPSGAFTTLPVLTGHP